MSKIFSEERCIDMPLYLFADLDLDVLRCQEDIYRISEQFVYYMISESHQKKAANLLRLQALLMGWLNSISYLGLDIQSLKFDPFGHERRKSLANVFVACQAEQSRTWSQFDLIEHQGSLNEMDMLQWFLEESGMTLDSCDSDS
jgi:hypothetical protein